MQQTDIETTEGVAPDPAQEQVPVATDTVTSVQVQPTPPDADLNDDSPLLIIKPNIRACWPEIVLAVSLIAVVYFMSGLLVQGYADYVKGASPEQLSAFSSVVNKYGFWITILTFITLYVRILYIQHNEKLFLGKTYVEMHRGIIARKRTRINLDHIRTVDTNQGIIDRILNIGSIEVASAGTADSELVVGRILDPIDVRNAIKQQQQAVKIRE